MTTSESQVKKRPKTDLQFALRHLTGHRKGMEERFQTDRVSIGRGKNNHCSFDAEKERSVSHRHCEIRIEDEVAILYDIGSLNGTYVNGRRVRRAPLADGDELGLGREGPRLRFAMGAGGSSAPPPAAVASTAPSPSRPDERLRNHVGATAEERQPISFPSASQPPGLVRRRVIVAAIALAVLAAVIAGIILVQGLMSRIETLETGDETGNPGASTSGRNAGPDRNKKPGPAAIRAPGAVPSGPRGAVIRILGIVRDSRKRVVDQETLGFGAIVRPDGVATTFDVYERLKAWLARQAIDRQHDKVLLAAPSGSLTGAATIEARVLHPQAGKREDGNLVLLLLDEQSRMPRVPTTAPRTSGVKFYPPWEKPQDLGIKQLTDAEGGRVRPEAATLLRFEPDPALPPPPAGMPLFAGDELVGISFGKDLLGMAISSVPIQELLRHAETATAELITSTNR